MLDKTSKFMIWIFVFIIIASIFLAAMNPSSEDMAGKATWQRGDPYTHDPPLTKDCKPPTCWNDPEPMDE